MRGRSFGGGRWQRFAATSAAVEFDVRDLPGGAKVSDFSGNIGTLQVTATASQTQMKAGTPFNLKVRLEGDGYQPRPGSIDLAGSPEFTRRFRVRLEDDKGISETMREVTYTLRPLDAKVTEVPAVTVKYYDPNTEKVQTASSKPIALEVTPGPKLADEKPATPEEPPQTTDDSAGLQDLESAQHGAIFTRRTLAAGALILTGLVVGLVLVGGHMRRSMRALRQQRENRALAAQQQRAAGEVRRQLHSSVQSFHDVRELLQHMLRTRFGMPPGEITPHDAAERLTQSGVDEGLAKACAELLETCTAAEFAPGLAPAPLAELAAQAEQLVVRITGSPAPVLPRQDDRTEEIPAASGSAGI
jgi:hypothetical protein